MSSRQHDLDHGSVTIVPWDPTWATSFEHECALLCERLPNVCSMHHFGSTSVEGLSAKPIIDVLAVVPSVEEVEGQKTKLEEAGFVRCVERIPNGQYYYRLVEGVVVSHLHVAPEAYLKEPTVLYFRDALRSNTEWRDQYAELKKQLAVECHEDRRAYTSRKGTFVEAILKQYVEQSGPAGAFPLREGTRMVEEVSLAHLAEEHGTPAYVYSRGALEKAYAEYDEAFTCNGKTHPHLVCYAVKANPNLAVLNVLAEAGAGFDIVSVGELERVLLAGGSASKVVFSGVGKSTEELERALSLGIQCFNVESLPELHRLSAVASRMNKLAPIALRVNPDIDAKTHPYISTGLKKNKFGIPIQSAVEYYKTAASLPGIKVIGVACHIGSQLLDMKPLGEAVDKMLALTQTLRAAGINITHFDLGGGVGISYELGQVDPPRRGYVQDVVLKRLGNVEEIEVVLAMGRSLVANAGALITRVEYIKPTDERNFLVVDAAMNDLIRPALYSGYHEIVPISAASEVDAAADGTVYDVVGPICETGDFLGKDRVLNVKEGDLLSILSAGAYGSAMASNYNSRGRSVELLISGTTVHVARKREDITAQVAGEAIMPRK